MYIMISREIWKKHALVGFSKATNITGPSDSCYFEIFEKLTRACFFQIALEIMLLPIQIIIINNNHLRAGPIKSRKRSVYYLPREFFGFSSFNLKGFEILLPFTS